VVVTCKVPKSISYTVRPVPYITAENYVRILSQSCYILAYHVIEKKMVKIPISPEKFLEAMKNYQLYYRHLEMTFHSNMKRGESFEMELNLEEIKEIKKISDFIIFKFSNKRDVISGEMSFIYKGGLSEKNIFSFYNRFMSFIHRISKSLLGRKI
jgi:hypothetical protein